MSLSLLLDRLEPIASGYLRDTAPVLDAGRRFPAEGMRRLAEAGFYGVLTPVAHGGLGLGPDAAARIVNRVARECGSTAMVLCMHYCGAAVHAVHGTPERNRAIAAGLHTSTLAFSEVGSRSHFWAPMSTARADADHVVLDAGKSWVTSAHHADGYVWSSRPVAAEGASTIWYVPRGSEGLSLPEGFDGLGLRGNDSTPVTARGVCIPAAERLGPDGGGFAVMMEIVLPYFSVLNAGCAIGLAESAVERTAAHATATRHTHLGAALRDLPTIRAYLARMKIQTDAARMLWEDTLTALTTGRPDAMLRVLQVKAAAGDTAAEVTQTAMRVCGGAAYRKEVGVERTFRDAQAMSVMAPTSDVLYDFIGKALTGMELFG